MVIKLHINKMAIVGERFDYRNDIIKGKDYSEIIDTESEITGNIVTVGMKGYEQNNRFNRVALAFQKKSMMPSDFKNANEKPEFYCCETEIYGENGKEIDVDELVRLYAMRDQFLLRMKFIEHDFSSEGYGTVKYVETDMEEDSTYDSETGFLQMMKEWYYTFKRINASGKMSEEEKLLAVPKIEFQMEFVNKVGKTVNGTFGGCVLFGMDSEGRMTIVVDRFDLYNA